MFLESPKSCFILNDISIYISFNRLLKNISTFQFFPVLSSSLDPNIQRWATQHGIIPSHRLGSHPWWSMMAYPAGDAVQALQKCRPTKQNVRRIAWNLILTIEKVAIFKGGWPKGPWTWLYFAPFGLAKVKRRDVKVKHGDGRSSMDFLAKMTDPVERNFEHIIDIYVTCNMSMCILHMYVSIYIYYIYICKYYIYIYVYICVSTYIVFIYPIHNTTTHTYLTSDHTTSRGKGRFRTGWSIDMGVEPRIGVFPPQIIHGKIRFSLGFSIIFTIHLFFFFPPLFLETPI